MTGLMHGCKAQRVVRLLVRAGQCASEVDAAIQYKVVLRRIGERKVAESQQAAAQVAEEIEVENFVCTLMEGRFHLEFSLCALS